MIRVLYFAYAQIWVELDPLQVRVWIQKFGDVSSIETDGIVILLIKVDIDFTNTFEVSIGNLDSLLREPFPPSIVATLL